MDARLQLRVQRYGWDKAADHYERYWAEQLTPAQQRLLGLTLAYASGEDACGAAFAGGPVALAYSRFDAPTRAEAETEYLASLAPYRRGDAYEVPGEFGVARGTRAAH